ncbi:hypothetical protein QBC46DRAFT_258061 [Diplogelasinospora grovesii]|uniref:Zn(2)-C6 fungal-type domain-containing protein n=1 Tax=Diplogelasinospora grovesii TaxID=303347 RepID=A0AAN6NBI4_9PEZI|nr:hypothetical protein QBC46DRAFT_258061 [Diplogelasinospora grovesii]
MGVAPVGGGSGVFIDDYSQPKSVKRPRPVKSCIECRKRKLKCDRLLPCSQCQKSRRFCKYAAESEAGNASDGSGGEVDVEGQPPMKRPQRPQIHPYPGAVPAAQRMTPVVNGTAEFPALRACAEGMDETTLARLERLERLVTEHMSVSPSPLSQHQHGYSPNYRVAASPITLRGLSVKGALRTRFFGQNSAKVLINLFDEASSIIKNMPTIESPLREFFMTLRSAHRALQREHRRALEPISVYVDSIVPIQKRMADILPPQKVCDVLVAAYISVSEGLYRVIHVPTFRQEYAQYWETKGQGSHDGFLPRLLCMLSIGSRFVTESRGLGHDRSTSVHIPTACALVRGWLDGLRGKHLVDITTLQTEILLLHAQRNITPRQQESWTQLGYIVRMAMTIGLHRDPSEFRELRAFQGEYRRKLWYTVMDMDLHVALACGLPCGVREGEYSCRPPRNLDDEDLTPRISELPPSKPLDQHTIGQLQAYAANTLPARMKATSIVSRLDTVHDYQEVLEAGATLEKMLDDINSLFPRHAALSQDEKHKEWRTRALVDIHVRRPLLALYRPFALSSINCPPHITQTHLKSSMTMLTYIDEVDPNSPGYDDLEAMYQFILKHDIIEACFSVCYYILNAHDNALIPTAPSKTGEPWHPGLVAADETTTPSSNGGGASGFNDGRFPWSAASMIRTVERSLVRLIRLLRDSSSDLRDIVGLSVVLSTVQAGTPEQKLERIRNGLQRIVDACLQALSVKPDGISSSLPVSASFFLPPVALPGGSWFRSITANCWIIGNSSYPPHTT